MSISALVRGSGVIMHGIEGVQKSFKEMAEKVEKAKKQAMIDACELLVSDIKTSMINTEKNEDPSSWSYHGRVAPHKPSLPFNPPAVDFSNLIKSIKYILFEEPQKIIGDVGSYNVDYAMDLEFGSPRVEPRPWLGPALTRNQLKIEQRFKQIIIGMY